MSDTLAGTAGNPPNNFADDLLVGAAVIAEFLGMPQRRVYYVHEKKLLPIGNVGRTLIARRSELVGALSHKREDA